MTEHELDILMDHLGTLNDETARIRVGPESPIRPEIIFGLDTALWSKSLAEGEEAAWADLGGVGKVDKGPGGHSEEVEVATVWRGGRRPGGGSGSGKKGAGAGVGVGQEGCGHKHEAGEGCVSHGLSVEESREEREDRGGEVVPVERARLEAELAKLSFEIYRGTPFLVLPCH